LKNIELFGLGGARVVWGSVTDEQVVRKTVREHDLVFHLAANIHVDESRERPADFFVTNVLGTFNVAESCRQFGVPLFHVSSCEVYGNQRGTLTEDSPPKPSSPYAASKAGAESLVYSYATTYGLRAMIARPGNVFGPGQRGGPRGAVIPRFMERAQEGEDIVIYGDGLQRRDFVYVNDVVRAYLYLADRLLESGRTVQVFNIATGRDVTIKSIAEKIVALSGSGSRVVVGEPRPGEVVTFNLCSDALLKTGFSFGWIFEEGLREYISRTQCLNS